MSMACFLALWLSTKMQGQQLRGSHQVLGCALVGALKLCLVKRDTKEIVSITRPQRTARTSQTPTENTRTVE